MVSWCSRPTEDITSLHCYKWDWRVVRVSNPLSLRRSRSDIHLVTPRKSAVSDLSLSWDPRSGCRSSHLFRKRFNDLGRHEGILQAYCTSSRSASRIDITNHHSQKAFSVSGASTARSSSLSGRVPWESGAACQTVPTIEGRLADDAKEVHDTRPPGVDMLGEETVDASAPPVETEPLELDRDMALSSIHCPYTEQHMLEAGGTNEQVELTSDSSSESSESSSAMVCGVGESASLLTRLVIYSQYTYLGDSISNRRGSIGLSVGRGNSRLEGFFLHGFQRRDELGLGGSRFDLVERDASLEAVEGVRLRPGQTSRVQKVHLVARQLEDGLLALLRKRSVIPTR